MSVTTTLVRVLKNTIDTPKLLSTPKRDLMPNVSGMLLTP
jgi:hypothetical protein